MDIFDQIIKGELPSDKVLEDDDFLAFKDINPHAPIHVLIVPKICVKDFNEVEPKMMKKMTKFIKKVVQELGIKEEGYRLVTNVGKNGGQEVPHLHFHLLAGAKLAFPKLA